MFLATVKQVKLEVRPLFLPQLVQLTSMLKPGLYSICVSFVESLKRFFFSNNPKIFHFAFVFILYSFRIFVCNTFKLYVNFGTYVRIIKINCNFM